MMNHNCSAKEESERQSACLNNTELNIGIDIKTRTLGLYIGPDLDTLPCYLKEMMGILLRNVLEVSSKENLLWKVNCSVNTCATFHVRPCESVEYQRDHDSSFYEPIVIEAYEYIHEFTKTRICPVSSKSNQEDGIYGNFLFAPVMQELRERFKNAYPEQIASMMTYDVLSLTREL